ncbi:flagellar protein FlaF [Limimaricola variabilis]|uniref:Flagellar protein FlaF n=1 Tax=Limimaricola variabilis TaxID=1492771 RepID=A0ABR6HSF6_9RHOB|nr:flagellar biosynthesis regulator FlaF [Limimaricola variabilis]MBB3713477.1 flagellar protein FlaF [Limimaricola variabilis]
MSIAAYKTTIRESESPRQIERRIIARITAGLSRHAEAYDGAESATARSMIMAEGLMSDLLDNQKLWNELRFDLASPENALPAELRAGLISLAFWVDRQTSTVLGGSAGVGALVRINSSVAAGLAGQAPEGAVA